MPSEPRLSARLLVGDPGAAPRLDLALALPAGITVVTGPSGAGKTTLLLALAGLIRPREGRVVLDGATLFDADARVDRPTHRRAIALVFQSLALFPHLDARGNVAYGIRGVTRADRRERAQAWLERAQVGHLAERRPASLSGGEAQRVAFARALASEPRLLLLDEPFSAMDPGLREELGGVLAQLVADADIPAILVTHDRSDAERLADRVLRLERGRLVEPEAAADRTPR